MLVFLSLLLVAEALRVEEKGYEGEAYADERSHDGGDTFPTVEPLLVVPADGVDGAPEAVREVEPQGYVPDQIAQNHEGLAEVVADEGGSVLRRDHLAGQRHFMVSGEFSEHHLVPELTQVKAHEADHNHADGEHVLRCPAYARRTGVDRIAIVTASLAILQRQHRCINEMEHHEAAQYNGCGHSVPIRAQQSTDHVIGVR